MFSQVFAGVQKFGRGLKENMSPQQKGDWKELMLMSLSFAVYVYVCLKRLFVPSLLGCPCPNYHGSHFQLIIITF